MNTRMVITLWLTLLALAGCPDPSALVVVSPLPTTTSVEGTLIPFETILREQNSSHLGMEPLLFLVDGLEDATPVLEYLAPDRQAIVVSHVQDLIYTPGIIIALFRETQANSGYEVTIDRVVQQGNQLHVYAKFWEPGPRYPVNPAGTSPYHIVRLLQPVESSEVLQLVLHPYPMIHDP